MQSIFFFFPELTLLQCVMDFHPTQSIHNQTAIYCLTCMNC